MKPTIYTVITYIAGEEGWHDRCGDYHSGKESELKIQYFTDKNEAGEACGISQFENSDAEIKVLIDGMSPDECHDFLTTEEQEDLSWEVDDIFVIGHKKHEQLQEVARKQAEEVKLKKEQEEALKKQKEIERIEKIEREQLAQLMAKYKQ